TNALSLRPCPSTKPRQFGPVHALSGILRILRTAWWAREDSNLQPDRYSPGRCLHIPYLGRRGTTSSPRSFGTIVQTAPWMFLSRSARMTPIPRSDLYARQRFKRFLDRGSED